MKKLLTLGLIVSAFSIQAQSTDGMEIVLNEEFKNNKNAWETSMERANKSKIDYNNQTLVIGINEKDAVERASCYTGLDFNKDFVLKVEVKAELKDKSFDDKTEFGVYFGFTNYKYKYEQGWYGMKLRAKEKGGFYYAANSNGTQLFKREMPNLRFTPDDFNEIAVAKVGDEVIYYLNGSEVYRNSSTETAGGAITMFGRSKHKMTTRKITVYQPSEPTPEEIAEEEAIAEVISEEEEEVILEAVSNLQFDSGKSTIKAASMGPLNEMAEMMVRNTQFRVLLKGHTDSQGGDATNLKLSQSRVNKVKDHLVSKGIDGSRIVALGYGDKQPIATNETAEGRQKNRRVEFEIIQ